MPPAVTPVARARMLAVGLVAVALAVAVTLVVLLATNGTAGMLDSMSFAVRRDPG